MDDARPIVQPSAPGASAALPIPAAGVPADEIGIRPGVRGVGLAILLAAIAISFFAMLGLVSPAVPLAVRNHDLDRAITGLAAGIASMAALLQWNRYREDEDPAALLLATGLFVLAAENLFNLLVGILGLQDTLGFSVDTPGQAPIYGWILSRAVAAFLFGLAAVAQLRHWNQSPRPAPLFALGITGLVVLAFPIFHLNEAKLPPLYDVRVIQEIYLAGSQVGIAPGRTASIVLLNALVTASLIGAAVLHRVVYQRTGQRQSILLSYALVIGALAQVQFSIVPPSYLGLVSAGDFLRVGFYAALVLVFEADTRSTLRDLRLSRRKIEELMEAQTTQAVMAERSRMGRDLHDGLAQELWLAKLRLGRLIDAVGKDPGTVEREASGLTAAIDSAIAESRMAVIAMNVRPGDTNDIAVALGRYVHDVTERLELPVSFRVDRPAPPLDVRVSEEILRAVHEALHNVRKHAQATSAVVALDAGEGHLRVTVTDDGRGIRPGDEARGYGLRGMRDRVEALGGQLRVESFGHGTRVILEVPIEHEAPRPGAAIPRPSSST